MGLRMTKDQVKKEVSEEEIEEQDGGAWGCFLIFLGGLFLALFLLPSIFESMLS